MKLALRIGLRGWGKTSPNPMVGAVIVKDGKIISTGYHRHAGEPHAEIIAINKAGNETKGATLYVSLEPCAHYGKTPPCTDKIIESGIKRVVIPIIDPNPLVMGKGIKRLKEAGVDITLGVCKKLALKANEIFFKWIRTGLPFVYLKLAVSLDGRIAKTKGERVKLTNNRADRVVHHIRAGVDAIIVGKKTIKIDDPILTTRLVKGKSPKRIILTKSGEIDPDARIFSEGTQPVIVATNNPDLKSGLFDIWYFDGDKISGYELLKRAAENGITSILIEGGSITASWAINERIVDKVMIFITPFILGKGINALELCEEFMLRDVEIKRVDDNILVSGYTPWSSRYEG